MPKKAKELSGLAVSRLKTEGSFAVVVLTAYISETEASPDHGFFAWLWESELMPEVRPFQNAELGSWPLPEALAEAREKARELRKQIRMELTCYKKT